MPSRIVVTGGSGKVGRAVVAHLLKAGHAVLNLDIALPAAHDTLGCHTLKVDLTNLGQVFNALSCHFAISEPLPPGPPQRPDAVIHLAGYARNLMVPDDETFKTNVSSTYNVVEAACKLGIKKVVIASSICAYGVTYAEGDRDFASFPVTEETEARPTDAYSISKLCSENLARGFAERFGIDIYAMRIGAVIAPEDHAAAFAAYVADPGRWKVHGWAYSDIRDLARMFELAVETSGLGFQIFNAVNDGSTANMPTAALLAQQCPGVPVTGPFEDEQEAPIVNRKMRRLLGFREEHTWQKYFTP